MKSFLKYTALILVFCINVHHKAEAAPIVRDTVTELVLTYVDGTSSYFALEDNPKLIFNGDSVIVSVDTLSLTFHHKYVSRYHYRKRVAMVHIDSTICENYLPFQWNGTTFEQSGTQIAVVSSAVGGDSTIAMTVTVSPTTYGAIVDTIVENQLPYTINNITYYRNQFNAVGARQLHLEDTLLLENSFGCDSVLAINLTVYNNVDTTLFDTICENALPYMWDGLTFDAAGVQTMTHEAVGGADSTVHYTLVVNPVSSIQVSHAIPENQTPFYFAGQMYYSSQNDTIVLQNIFGCDSTIYLSLIVYNNQSDVIDSTVCESLLPLTWNDSVFTQAGIKEAHLLTVHGADSTVVMRLWVTPTVYSNVSETIIQNDLPYTYNNHTYSAESFDMPAGMFTIHDTITLLSVSGCDSIVYYTLTMHPNSTVYVDSTVCESVLPIVWNGVSFNEAGTHEAVLTACTGADSTVVMHLTVIPTTYGYFADTVEQSQLPYHFGGQTYNAPVINDSIFLTSEAGCDSVLLFSLTVISDSTVGIAGVGETGCTVSYSDGNVIVDAQNSGGTLFLYTVDGRLLVTRKIRPRMVTTLPMSAYPAGVYLIRYNNVTYKIVKI